MGLEVVQSPGNRGQMQVSFLESLEFEKLDVQFFSLPFSDLRRWIPENDLLLDVQKSFPLDRLGGVKQLGFLSYAGPDYERVRMMPYTHTRLLHSLQVSEVAYAIVSNSGGESHEKLVTRVGGAIHDIATPAHGDAVKLIDPENLDEEDHWHEVIGRSGKNFFREHGLQIREIDDIIHNKGILGQVLDIADRISYTMQDTSMIQGGGAVLHDVGVEPYTAIIKAILRQDPSVGNIYKDVKIDWKKEQAVFTDVDRLVNFLYLRAHLHKSSYLFPRNQGRDLFITKLLKPLYSPDEDDAKKDLLTPRVLRCMTDGELIRYLSDRYEFSMGELFFQELVNWHPGTSSFFESETVDVDKDVSRRFEELQNDPGVEVLGVRKTKPFNPGTGYFVAHRGKVETLHETDSRSMVLEEVARSVSGTHIFYVPRENRFIISLIKKMRHFEKQKEA